MVTATLVTLINNYAGYRYSRRSVCGYQNIAEPEPGGSNSAGKDSILKMTRKAKKGAKQQLRIERNKPTLLLAVIKERQPIGKYIKMRSH